MKSLKILGTTKSTKNGVLFNPFDTWNCLKQRFKTLRALVTLLCCKTVFDLRVNIFFFSKKWIVSYCLLKSFKLEKIAVYNRHANKYVNIQIAV